MCYLSYLDRCYVQCFLSKDKFSEINGVDVRNLLELIFSIATRRFTFET